MTGEIAELDGVLKRQRRLQNELRRAGDISQRLAIRSRLEEVDAEVKEVTKRIKAAADAGEPEAKQLVETLRQLGEDLGMLPKG